MGKSIRNYTTKEERKQMVIEKGNPTNSSKNKLSQYLSQPNVKKFNAIITDKGFNGVVKYGYPRAFSSVEECLEEVNEYFKLCYDCEMIPTIASLCLFLGINRDTLYTSANDKRTYAYSDVLKYAINTCQSYQESAVLSGDIPSVPFIFLSKNYFSLKDTTEVNLSANNQDNTINSDSMTAIKQQIQAENETKQLDYLKDNN